ncbi:hypothetical protein [Citrobacter werkmanii]|uniref:hypothetical protein n=1 Tax=Citrobacter werkmanii TaxID=67827 RepID=UPI0034D4AE6F
MTAFNKQALRSREEFEEYYNKTHAVKVTSQFKRFGYYVSPTMQKAWELWQKAQSSMRDELKSAEKRIAELEARTVTVKLPADYRNDDGSINADMFNTCAVVGAFREALTAAGIGVKGE